MGKERYISELKTFILGAILATFVTWFVTYSYYQSRDVDTKKIFDCLFNLPVHNDYNNGSKYPQVVNLSDVTKCQK